MRYEWMPRVAMVALPLLAVAIFLLLMRAAYLLGKVAAGIEHLQDLLAKQGRRGKEG